MKVSILENVGMNVDAQILSSMTFDKCPEWGHDINFVMITNMLQHKDWGFGERHALVERLKAYSAPNFILQTGKSKYMIQIIRDESIPKIEYFMMAEY